MAGNKRQSAHGMKLDQLYVAKKELTKDERRDLKSALKTFDKETKGVRKEAAAELKDELDNKALDFEDECEAESFHNTKFLERLKRTAKRKKMSVTDYARKYLV